MRSHRATPSPHRQVAEAFADAGGLTVAELGLRFDRVVVRVLDDLSLALDATTPDGLTVLLALTAPIRLPGKMVAALEQEIIGLLRTGAAGSMRSVTVHENRAELRLVERALGRTEKLVGFAHNASVDVAQVFILAAQWLRSNA